MKTFFLVHVKTSNSERFFLKCQELNIPLFETSHVKDGILVKVLDKDYPKLKKIWFIKTTKLETLGFQKIKNTVWQNRVFLLALVFAFFLLYFISHIIVSVEVIHSNKEIRDIVEKTLKEHGIKKNTWKKGYQEIQNIKEAILNEYPDKLEWLEIETKGMKYVIRIEERKINEEETKKEACHIVASKSGIIREIIYSEGQSVYRVNDYVREGDILIQGIITKDEEEKSVVCATGQVYAEVWYQVTVHIPLTYQTKKETGKNRWNIKINDAFLFKSRLDTYIEEVHPLFSIFNTVISFVKQKEVIEQDEIYTEEQALELALKEVETKVSSTLKENEAILEKKVLKKDQNNSTMNVEVFVAVQESIGIQQEFEKELGGNNGDTSINGSN